MWKLYYWLTDQTGQKTERRWVDVDSEGTISEHLRRDEVGKLYGSQASQLEAAYAVRGITLERSPA